LVVDTTSSLFCTPKLGDITSFVGDTDEIDSLFAIPLISVPSFTFVNPLVSEGPFLLPLSISSKCSSFCFVWNATVEAAIVEEATIVAPIVTPAAITFTFLSSSKIVCPVSNIPGTFSLTAFTTFCPFSIYF